AGRAHRRLHLAAAPTAAPNEVGAFLALTCAPALYDPHGGRLSLEFSLAAIIPSRSRALRSERIADATRFANSGRVGFAFDSCHDSDVDLWCGRRLRPNHDVDLFSSRGCLGPLRAVCPAG